MRWFRPLRALVVILSVFSSSAIAQAARTGQIVGVVVNASQPLAPYRSEGEEVGYKFMVGKVTFTSAAFRIERPFASYVSGVTSAVCGAQSGTSGCQEFAITGRQVTSGVEAMLSGRLSGSLMVTGGVSILDPTLQDTGTAATNGRHFVGIPNVKSNVLAGYRLPRLAGMFLNVDWQHVGRRPIDDINSVYTPQYNVFDLGVRYTTTVGGKLATWRVTVDNLTDVRYWSTLGPGSITGQSTGSYLGHLGEPRLVTASLRIDF